MRRLLSIEEAAQFLLCVYLLHYFQGPFSGALLCLIFFAPDVFALGFLVSNRTGTYLYNFSHHKLMPGALIIIGLLYSNAMVIQLGVLWYAHITFDRTIGYGLKYLGNPNHTHLGFIGKEKYKNKINESATN